MSSSALIRWGAIGLVLAGGAWVASGLLDVSGSIAAPSDPDHLSKEQLAERLLSPNINDVLDVVVDIVGLLFLALGLVGLHALQKESYGRIGRTGFYTALAATALRLLVAVADAAWLAYLLWRGPLLVLSSSLFPVSLVGPPVGLLGSLVGFTLLGVATLRARVLPRWYGVLLIVFEPVAAAHGVWMLIGLPVTGFLLFGFLPPAWVSFWGPWAIWRGLVFVVLGYVLWRRSNAPARQPSGAS